MSIDGNTLTVAADENWINDSERAFPVVIDPTIGTSTSSAVLDTYVSSSWLLAGTKYYNSINLYAGKLSTGSFCRTYVKFNLATLPGNSTIKSANFSIKKWDSNTGNYNILVYDAYKYNWDTNNLTFNNQPLSKNADGLKNQANLPLVTSDTGLAPSNNYYNINVTDAVKRWYDQNGANGLVISSVGETVNGQAAFHSANALSTDERPVLTVSYTLPTATITYNGNGHTAGTVPSYQSVVTPGDISVSVPGSMMKSGHSFGGWMKPDGSIIAPTTTISWNSVVEETLVLTAVWNESPVIDVSNAAEFIAALNDSSDGRTISLADDINLGAWAPYEVSGDSFTINGNGKILTFSASIASAATMYVGLFGEVKNGSKIIIEDLGLTGNVSAYSIYSGGTVNLYAGGLVGLVSDSTVWVDRSYFFNSQDGNGAFLDEVNATRDQRTSGAYAHAGGFFGEVRDSNVSFRDCYVKAKIVAKTETNELNNPTSFAGGFIGKNTGTGNLAFERCYAMGSVKSYAKKFNIFANASSWFGGLIGKDEIPVVRTTVVASHRFNDIIDSDQGNGSKEEDMHGVSISENHLTSKSVAELFGPGSFIWSKDGSGNNNQFKNGGYPILNTSPLKVEPNYLNNALVKVIDDRMIDDKPVSPGDKYSHLISMGLVDIAGITSYDENALAAELTNAGFDDFFYDDYGTELIEDWQDDCSPHFFATRMLDGKKIVIVALAGTGSEGEYGGFETASFGTWLSNFKMSRKAGGYHEGFYNAMERVYDNLMLYLNFNGGAINTLGDNENLRILITGYSRGAAVGNLLAAKLNDEYRSINVDPIETKHVINYNYAVPGVYDKNEIGAIADGAYDNVFNICNEWDIISYYPLPELLVGEWGKYGQTLWFNNGSWNDQSLGAHNPRLAIDHLRNTATPALGDSKEPQFVLTLEYGAAELIVKTLIGALEVEEVVSNYVFFTLEEMETICALFDVEFYAENNPNVVALYGDSEAVLLNHFLSAMSGEYELLDTFSQIYNSDGYFQRNQEYILQNPGEGIPEIPMNKVLRLQHFINHGMTYGLSALPVEP